MKQLSAVSTPMSTTEDDPRGLRKKEILEKLAQISKQQNIPQEKDIKSLQKLVEDAVKDVERLGKGLDKQRATRNIFTKSGNALQKFASSFSKFLKAYSGISELSKGVDSQYGGMVVGALSLLFQVRKLTFCLEKIVLLIPHRSGRTRRAVRLLSLLLSRSSRDHGSATWDG